MPSTVKAALAKVAYAGRRVAPGASRLLPKWLRRLVLLHIVDVNRPYAAFPQSASRRFLEDQVLPRLRDTCPRILFVGAGSYTYQYEKIFRADAAQFTTIDSNPGCAVWGARQHIMAPVQEIGRHRAEGSFDCVVLNGVFGFGVDDPAAMRSVVEAVHAILRPGGRMVLGWNADLHPDPAELGVLGSEFAPDPSSPWGARRTFPGETHVNDFYVRR